jgi:hypothetical protein
MNGWSTRVISNRLNQPKKIPREKKMDNTPRQSEPQGPGAGWPDRYPAPPEFYSRKPKDIPDE